MASCAKAAYSLYLERMDRPPAPVLVDYESEIVNHDAFALELSGEVIGLLVLHISDSGVLLDNVAVLPGYQGRGYGHQLMALAEEQAIARGFAQITLYTNEVMTENIELYQRLGYLEYERVMDKGYHRVYMRKSLRATSPPE